MVFLSKLLQELGVYFDPVEHRLRCIGHVTNLVVKAFLYGANLDLIGRNNKDEVEDLWNWRVRRPYGRLRNIITYICWTPQRRDEFAELVQDALPEETAFQPIAANLPRWNSDFKAIKRALQLRTGFEVFAA